MLDLKGLKDKKSKMPEMEQNAKMSVLDHIKREATKDMGGKLKGIKKVGVMASDKQGLEEGLDKAKELLSGEEGGESPEEEAGEMAGSDELSPEELALSPEQLDEKIQQLMALKEKMEQKPE